MSDEDVEAYEQFEDISKWHPVTRAEGEAIYGAENLQKGWSGALVQCPSLCLSLSSHRANLMRTWRRYSNDAEAQERVRGRR